MERVTLFKLPEKDIVGLIIKFEPGAHTRKPYYAQIVYYNPNPTTPKDIVLSTSIPGRHRLDMTPENNLRYHLPRISVVGPPTEENLTLLHNQIIE